MSEDQASVTSPPAGGAFGPNAWLVDDMYEEYRSDPSSVSESWREFFADYVPPGGPAPETPGATNGGPASTNGGPASTNGAPAGSVATVPAPTSADDRAVVASPPAQPSAAPAPAPAAPAVALTPATDGPAPVALRGAAARIAVNMEASLAMPTATSVRTVPAKLLEVNRSMLNQHLARTSGAKVSFTHLIGYAVVQALQAVPALNTSFVDHIDDKGNAGVIHHDHVGLGLAVDVSKNDGSHTLLVPVVRHAESLDFRAFVVAYEDLVRKVHTQKVTADDLAGATVTLTNPGTLGTVQSVPRLMPGQGAIIGVGTIDYPAEWQAADPRIMAELGVSKVVTITSTYDHRVIQGAESGLFLSHMAECLTGQHGFYESVFAAMDVPYQPVRWQADVNAG